MMNEYYYICFEDLMVLFDLQIDEYLELSIAKWMMICQYEWQYRESPGLDFDLAGQFDWTNCGLCSKYWGPGCSKYWGPGCIDDKEQCPLGSCSSGPLSMYLTYMCLDNAQAMVDKLISLRDK